MSSSGMCMTVQRKITIKITIFQCQANSWGQDVSVRGWGGDGEEDGGGEGREGCV